MKRRLINIDMFSLGILVLCLNECNARSNFIWSSIKFSRGLHWFTRVESETISACLISSDLAVKTERQL